MSLTIEHKPPIDPVIAEIMVESDFIPGDWIAFKPDSRGLLMSMRGSRDGSPRTERYVTHVRINPETLDELVDALTTASSQVNR